MSVYCLLRSLLLICPASVLLFLLIFLALNQCQCLPKPELTPKNKTKLHGRSVFHGVQLDYLSRLKSVLSEVENPVIRLIERF